MEFCRQNRQIAQTYVNLPMESYILSTHNLCWAIKKNWWNTHSLCIWSMAYLWIGDYNLKMIEKENTTALSMLNLYYG